MSKDYWMDVLNFEISPECQKHYKNLESMYRDCWENRSILQEIDLAPISITSASINPTNPKMKLPRLTIKSNNKFRQTSLKSSETPLKQFFPQRRKSSIPSNPLILPTHSFRISSRVQNQRAPKNKPFEIPN